MAQRYEHARPGELLHLDTKKLGRIAGVGHRITGRAGNVNLHHGIGWEYLHIAVDDHSRVAYVELLGDERGVTAAGFLRQRSPVVSAAPGPRAPRSHRQRLGLHLP